jgi:hypothetical protein
MYKCGAVFIAATADGGEVAPATHGSVHIHWPYLGGATGKGKGTKARRRDVTPSTAKRAEVYLYLYFYVHFYFVRITRACMFCIVVCTSIHM